MNSVQSFYGAKFEPSDGKIYSGAGQSPEAILQMTLAGDPNQKPMVIATYDKFNGIDNDGFYYKTRYDILAAQNL